MRGIQDTPVWPWSTTHEDLSTSLSRLLENHELALGSTIGMREFAAEFADTLGLHPYSAVRAPKLAELTNWTDEWLDEPGRGPRDSIMFGIGNRSYTFKELKLIRATLPELPRNHDDTLAELWPDKDKPRPTGRRAVWWYELYTEERLLERANAIFNGALRIYNDIVARWFAAFNKRHQLSYVEPLALDGVLTLTTTPGRRALGDAGLIWWPRLVNSSAESGVFFELDSTNRIPRSDIRERIRAAGDDFFLRGRPFHHTIQLLPGNGPRPATELAYRWLSRDLRDLGWL